MQSKRARLFSWLPKTGSPTDTIKGSKRHNSVRPSAESSSPRPVINRSKSSPFQAPKTHPAYSASVERATVHRQPSLPPGAAPSRALQPPSSPKADQRGSFVKRSASSLSVLFSGSRSEPDTRLPTPTRSSSSVSKLPTPPGLGSFKFGSRDRAPTPPPKVDAPRLGAPQLGPAFSPTSRAIPNSTVKMVSG